MDRASRGLNDFMDKHEGRKEGSSTAAIMKERKRQGYDKKHEVAKKMKRGNYSIFKIEGDKHTRLKHNMSHAEMSEQLKNNPAYKGGEGYGFGGRRTYKK